MNAQHTCLPFLRRISMSNRETLPVAQLQAADTVIAAHAWLLIFASKRKLAVAKLYCRRFPCAKVKDNPLQELSEDCISTSSILLPWLGFSAHFSRDIDPRHFPLLLPKQFESGKFCRCFLTIWTFCKNRTFFGLTTSVLALSPLLFSLIPLESSVFTECRCNLLLPQPRGNCNENVVSKSKEAHLETLTLQAKC